MRLLLLALIWLPFSVGLFTFDLFGVTFTIYILAMLVLCPLSAWRLAKGQVVHPAPSASWALLALNTQAILLQFSAPDVVSMGALYGNYSSSKYGYVHGLLIPSASYMVIKLLVDNDRDFKRSVSCLVLGCSIFGLIYLGVSVRSESLSRVVVFGRDAIAAACFFSVALIYLAYTPLLGRMNKWVLMAVNGIGLLMTLSRGFVVAGLLTPAIYRWARPRRLLYGFSAFLVATLIATFISIANKDLFRPLGWDPKLENSAERLLNLQYWKSGIYGRLETFIPSVRAFQEAPLFGSGFAVTKVGATVHNFHLEWLEITGVIGYLLFLLVFVGHFVRIVRWRVHDRWILASSLSIFVIFVNGLLNGVLHGVMPYVLFIVLGLGDAYVGIRSRHPASGSMLRRWVVSHSDRV